MGRRSFLICGEQRRRDDLVVAVTSARFSTIDDLKVNNGSSSFVFLYLVATAGVEA